MHAAGPSSWPITSPAVLPSAIPDHELLCLIGRGAYGEVWMARNAISTLRAVKIVHRRSFQRVEHFEREFKGLLKFEPISRSHDGLVDILQIGRRDDAGYFFYVMELADAARLQSSDTPASETESVNLPCPAPQLVPQGSLEAYIPRTLRSELHQRGSLPSAECVTVGIKLASALQHLHSNGLVHRDIKPSNIIFVKGEPKLADIGLVTAIDDAHSLVGTAGYIPPEGPGTPQADLYSLGKVLYEIAFGKDRQDFPQLPADLQSHPDYAALLELNELILKACETDPARRYSGANDLEEDLSLLQKGVSLRQNRIQAKRWAIARKCISAGATVALFIAALLVFQSIGREYKPKPEAADLYQKGQWHYNQLTPMDHEKARDYLNQAVRADPRYVRPYGEMMALYTWNMLPGITNEQIRLQKVQEIANKALAVDPNSAEGYMALSWCCFLQRDWSGAEAQIKRAIKLNPDLALAHDVYSFYLSAQGRVADAHREGQFSANQPIVSRRASAVIASWPFVAERKFDPAIKIMREVLDQDGKFTWGYSYLGDYLEATSNYVDAINSYRAGDLLEGKNADRVNARYDTLRQAFYLGGREAYFRKWVEVILADQSLPEEKRTLGFGIRELAGYYAQLGEKEKALKLLEDHFDEPNTWHQIKFLWWFDPLHDDPRFKALVKRAKLEP